jgi:carbonic anhydrase
MFRNTFPLYFWLEGNGGEIQGKENTSLERRSYSPLQEFMPTDKNSYRYSGSPHH